MNSVQHALNIGIQRQGVSASTARQNTLAYFVPYTVDFPQLFFRLRDGVPVDQDL